MKKTLCILTLAMTATLAANPAIAQSAAPMGQVLEGLKLQSPILGREVRYAVYLPAGYDSSTRLYPVVYLLHGYTDNESGWVQFGEVQMAADRAIAAREIPPMIIVMPDGGVAWYMNDYRGQVRWEDMFVQEFIPFIDKTYRTRAAREFRGVSGLSMGGWGSLLLSMRHPDLFAACAAFSAAVWTEEDAAAMDGPNYDRVFAALFGPRTAGQVTDHFKAYNPLNLAKVKPEDDLKKVRYYIDCGDDDFLIKGNCYLHVALLERKIPHEFRVRDGAHNWSYWRTGIVDGLKFIGQSFHR